MWTRHVNTRMELRRLLFLRWLLPFGVPTSEWLYGWTTPLLVLFPLITRVLASICSANHMASIHPKEAHWTNLMLQKVVQCCQEQFPSGVTGSRHLPQGWKWASCGKSWESGLCPLLALPSAPSASTTHMATLSPPHCALLNSVEKEVGREALTLSTCKTHSDVESPDSCQYCGGTVLSPSNLWQKVIPSSSLRWALAGGRGEGNLWFSWVWYYLSLVRGALPFLSHKIRNMCF